MIAAGFVTSVNEALSLILAIEEIFCWSDSRVVVCWIQSDKDYKQFVFNRRSEIVKLTGVGIWKHCAGTGNPVDFGSRDVFANNLVSNELWWKAPSRLIGPPESYPVNHTIREEEIVENCEKEVKVQSNITITLAVTHEDKESAIINATRFSNWAKLLRVIALVRKFIAVLKNPVIDRAIAAEVILAAERLWMVDM